MVPARWNDTMTSVRPTRASTRRSPGREGFRPEIQGLRAVAVLLVVLYHAGVPALSGGFVGVDVFFVISGFLITGGLVKELRTRGSVSLSGFYSRRAARILPAATVAIAGVIVMTLVFLPMTRWAAVGRDALSSSLYFINWSLAGSSVDYLARDQAASPLQHFWSLAVEEQFYLIWPLLLIAVALVSRRWGRRGAALGVAFFLLSVPSLLWSVYMTSTDPGPAYFVTTTRIWELAVGAGLAMVTARELKVGESGRAIVGWLGLVAVVASAVLYDLSTPFPGYAALLPTLGTAAVIWAGASSSWGPGALLSQRPAVWVGTISYSLYLWHWPFLVVAEAMFGELTLAGGLVVVTASLIPAWLSYRFVETPVLRWSKGVRSKTRPLQLGVLTSLASVTAALLLLVAIPAAAPTSYLGLGPSVVNAAPDTEAPPRGAQLLFDNPRADLAVDTFKEIVPSPLEAVNDLPPGVCLQSFESPEARGCLATEGAEGGIRVALVGDSHAAMFAPGLAAAVAELGGSLVTYTKGACPLSATPVVLDGSEYVSCTEWVENVTAKLIETPPDVVYIGSAQYKTFQFRNGSFAENVSPVARGMAAAWSILVEAGIPVVSIRDAPAPGIDIPECVIQNTERLTRCSFPRAGALPAVTSEVLATEGLAGSRVLDLTDAICPTNTCPAVIDGILVYRDNNHLTATYSATLSRHFAASLSEVVEVQPEPASE
jgi:peptidoglycan/LPS O-acetylase OafA/YrhL